MHVVVYSPGIGWGAPTTISGSQIAPAQEVSVGIDDNGRIVATWSQSPSIAANNQLFIATGHTDGGWVAPKQLNNPNDGPAAGASALSVNGAGDVLSTWLGGNNNLNSAFAAISLPDGGWDSVGLDLSSLNKANIVNALGSSGTGATLWQQYHGTGSLQDCAAETLTSGTWSMTSVIDDIDAGYVSNIHLCAGGPSQFGAVWTQVDWVEFATFDGAQWSAPVPVANNGGEVPAIGSNDNGVGALAWVHNSNLEVENFGPAFALSGTTESLTPTSTGTDPIIVRASPAGTRWVIYRGNVPPMGYPAALASQCP